MTSRTWRSSPAGWRSWPENRARSTCTRLNRDVLGERAWIFTQGEAEKAGLFGPMGSFAREVLGNVLVFAKGNLAIVDSRYQSEGAIGLVGVHGSLTEQEMMVPLLIDHA